MAIPVQKVELGLQGSPAGEIKFTLDDPIKGVLDGPYTLAGDLPFVDVVSRVRRFSVSRGRSGQFNAFPAGQVNIEFNNHDRAFDPLYESSPFFGDIVPRREVRITSGTALIFTGWIDDWNYSYLPNGDSVAEAIAYDATSILSGQTLSLGTPAVELTGARVSAVLDEIEWSETSRTIDTGFATLGDQPIAEGTNAMNYLQSIALSEPGLVFVGRDGNVTFVDSDQYPTSEGLVTFGGTGIPFQSLGVIYGSDNLYNQVVLTRENGGTATATDTESVEQYGLRQLSQNGLLLNLDEDLAALALTLAEKYSLPEYRFSSLEVAAHKLSESEQAEVLQMELGSIARVIFSPNGIGDPIDRFLQVISIRHTVSPDSHFIEYGFEQIGPAYVILDDPEFGKLDEYTLR